MSQVATNQGEYFISISKVESYLYEWYFHLYVTLVLWQCYITMTKRNKNWNKTETRRRTKMHITMYYHYTHWTMIYTFNYNKHIIKWSDLPDNHWKSHSKRLPIAKFMYYHPPEALSSANTYYNKNANYLAPKFPKRASWGVSVCRFKSFGPR